MADCKRCIAKCAVHALRCEDKVMDGRDSIDCKTFIEGDREKEPAPPRILSVRELMDSMGG
jgi:hypothetical protein